MTQLNTYLTFNGNCMQAFHFYQSVFGGEFAAKSYFKDMPDDPQLQLSEADKNKIMHVSLPIGNTSVLMGSDAIGELAGGFVQGINFTVAINTDSQDEADRLFKRLSNKGVETMPMNQTFWGSYFGMLTDQFGIQWMISFDQTRENHD